MASKVKCGIYVIEQIDCQNYYIGSSKSVHSRWSKHRLLLRSGKHHSPYLQNAWTKYDEATFRFWIIEECEPSELLAKEQEYIDNLNPVFNVCPLARSRAGSKYTLEQLLRHKAIHSARAALITHCPRGHEYTEENTYRNSKNDRICRACNALRVSAIYEAETPEQREARRLRAARYAERTRERRLVQQQEYMAAHKEEKRAYDIAHRARTNELRKQRRATMTPEQRASQLEQKRQSYLRHHDKNLMKMRERYARRIIASL